MNLGHHNKLPSASKRKVFTCTFFNCNQVFKTKFSCKRHQLVHTKEKPFACEICGRKFGLLQHLKEHCYRHSKQKPYICGIKGCQEAFRHASELSVHRRTHPEYNLKKYNYVKESEEKESKKVVKNETADNCGDSSEWKVKSEIAISSKHGELGDEMIDLDFHYLNYLVNITVSKVGRIRPVLPLPAICDLKGIITSFQHDKHANDLKLINQ